MHVREEPGLVRLPVLGRVEPDRAGLRAQTAGGAGAHGRDDGVDLRHRLRAARTLLEALLALLELARLLARLHGARRRDLTGGGRLEAAEGARPAGRRRERAGELRLRQRADDVRGQRLAEHLAEFVGQRVLQLEHPQVVDRLRRAHVHHGDQVFGVLEVAGAALDEHRVGGHVERDAELVLGQRVAGVARVPEVLELRGDDLRRLPLQPERLERRLGRLVEQPQQFLLHVVEPALRRDEHDGVLPRQRERGDVLDPARRRAALLAELAAARGAADAPGRGVVAALPELYAGQEGVERVGDVVAVAVVEEDDLDLRPRVLHLLLQDVDELEDDLQVRGVGHAEDAGVQTGDGDERDGAARGGPAVAGGAGRDAAGHAVAGRHLRRLHRQRAAGDQIPRRHRAGQHDSVVERFRGAGRLYPKSGASIMGS